MSTAELRIDVISRIANLNEPHIIEEVSDLLDFELSKEVYQLTPQQKQRVSEGKTEYLKGKILTEEEANNDIEQWLNEK